MSEACVAALRATDDALYLAITAAPDADLPVLEEYVRQWEVAAAVARSGGDLCPVWPSMVTIAERLKCTRCGELIATAKVVMKCN